MKLLLPAWHVEDAACGAVRKVFAARDSAGSGILRMSGRRWRRFDPFVLSTRRRFH